MNTFWIAIDVEYASYEELKHRKVIAQGWRDLGDLTSLLGPLYNDENGFKQVVQLMGDAAYEAWWHEEREGETRPDRELDRAPTVMWNLLHLQKGDLVVGVEGKTVRGVCEVTENARSSYQYDAHFEYAQTVSSGVEWVDWRAASWGTPPTPPARGVMGVRNLVGASDHVIDVWRSREA